MLQWIPFIVWISVFINYDLILLHLQYADISWRTALKFPEEAKLSTETKDLICRLLCNVEQRLGTKGADEIKVL